MNEFDTVEGRVGPLEMERARVTKVVIQLGHSYKDADGTVWREPQPVTRTDEFSWKLVTGTGLLQRTSYFNTEGKPVSSMFAPFIEDLGLPAAITKDEPTPAIPPPSAAKAASPFYSHERYNELLAQTVQQIQSLSKLKGGEYAGDDDRLANFRRNAAQLGLPMEVIWSVYASKHWDAVQQYIRDMVTGKERTRLEGLAGRADDIIVYMTLFKAMLEEKGVK